MRTRYWQLAQLIMFIYYSSV